MDTKRLARLLLCAVALLIGAGLRAAPGTQATPFQFAPLGVGNPCFVDSVRFADTYLGGRQAGGSRWVRVLSWETFEEDSSPGQGHAVAIFQWRGGLFVFDINNGVRKLNVPVAQREDLHAVTAAVHSMYPLVKPVSSTSLDDSWTTRVPSLRGTDDAPITPAYRDVYRVAKMLAQQREVRVVRFSYLVQGKRQESAAAVFLFSRRLCVYVPEAGTLVLRQMLPTIDDDGLICTRLQRCFGATADVQLATAKPIPAGATELAGKYKTRR